MKQLRIDNRQVCEIYYSATITEERFEEYKQMYANGGSYWRFCYRTWLKDMTFEDFCAYISGEKEEPERQEYIDDFYGLSYVHLYDILREIVDDELYNSNYDFGDVYENDYDFNMEEGDK